MAEFKEIQIGADGQVFQVKDETARNNAGSGDGTVTGVKMNNGSPIEPDGDGVVDLGTVVTQHQDISGKVDKNGTDSLMTAAEHTKLQNLPTADELTQQMGTKANDNAVVKSISVNGTAQTKDGNGNVAISGLATETQLGQKQDTLTEGTGISITQNGTISVDADNTPTPNSPKPVTSGGVSTALQTLLSNIRIGANGNWYVGDITDPNNDTGVKAQGPTGNCTITDAGQMVSEIVNNLDDGGTSKFLSAEMGKKLKNAIVAIYNALSPYAFAFGKPIIDLNAIIPVTVTVGTHVTYTGPSMASVGNSIDIQLGTDDNLFVIDDDEVTVTMGGNDVTEDYYIKAQSKISIPSVIGEVVITVGNAVTYIDADGTGNQLAFFLDCKNRGSQANHWIDLIGGVDFALTNVTEANDGMVFNGSSSKGVASGSLNVSYASATVEAVIDISSLTPANGEKYPILSNILDGSAAALFRTTSSGATRFIACATNGTGITDANKAFFFDVNNKAFGNTQGSDTVIVDGEQPEYPRIIPGANPIDVNDYGTGLSSAFAVGYGNFNGGDKYFKGKILAIRVYSTQLTIPQMQSNYAIDKKRFNL